MKTVVISQPMFFPWIGLFEQIALADVYVHYDDVQLPLGRSFITRVQIKTVDGVQWMTIPIVRNGQQLIRDVRIDNTQDWRRKHLGILKHAFAKAEHAADAIGLVDSVYATRIDSLAMLNAQLIEKIAAYFEIKTEFRWSSDFASPFHSSEKLLDLVQKLGAVRYITGHGARNYLDHPLFDQAGVAVEYMNYECRPYQQLHGPFTPYVSILDLIANLGRSGRELIVSRAIPWRQMLAA
jgi:hypothetical protein